MAVPSLARAESLAAGEASRLTQVAQLVTAYGPPAVVLTLPLEFTAVYLRQPVVRWVLVVLGAAYVYLLLTGRRTLALPRRASALLLLAFIALAVAGWLVTRAQGSLRELGDVVVYPVVGLVLMNTIRTAEEHRRAWVALLVSGLAVAVLGIWLGLTHQAIWTFNPLVANRDNITFADPNITARFLSICAAAAVMLYSARRMPAWLALSAGVACAVVQPMTLSRSGLVLFVVSVLLGAALAVDRRRALVFGLGLVTVFALSTAINPETRQRALAAADTVVSTVTGTAHNISAPYPGTNQDTFALEDQRRYLIAAGASMFADHPVFGVGLGGYEHQLKTTYSRFIPTNIPRPDTVSHTAFVTIAAEEGLAGLVLVLAFLVQLGREAWRWRRVVWVAAPAAMIMPVVLYSQFEGRFLEEPYLWLFLALFYSALPGATLLRGRSHTM